MASTNQSVFISIIHFKSDEINLKEWEEGKRIVSVLPSSFLSFPLEQKKDEKDPSKAQGKGARSADFDLSFIFTILDRTFVLIPNNPLNG